MERHEAEIRLTLAFAVTGTCVGFVFALYLAYLFPGIPLSVLLLEWAGAILLAAGVPFIARSIRRRPHRRKRASGYSAGPAPIPSMARRTSGIGGPP